MRYPNFLNGSRVVFSTRKQRGPLWQAPRTCRPASRPKTWGCQPTNFIVQCGNSQRPGCMADTTGPMPLIRWRDEGKRRLGLGFTSLGRSRRPFAPRLAHTGDGRVEIAHWRLRPPATLRRHLERPDGPARSTGSGSMLEGTRLRPCQISPLRGSSPGSRAFRLDDACGVEARDLGIAAAELAQHLGCVLTQKRRR